MGIGTAAYGDRWGRRYSFFGDKVETGTILKLVAGIEMEMGMRAAGTVEDGRKYLSPFSSLDTRLSQKVRTTKEITDMESSSKKGVDYLEFSS